MKVPAPGPAVATAVPARTVVNPVDAQVTAAQLPAIQQIAAAQAASKRAAEDATTSTTGYYDALTNILKGIGPAVQQGYTTAAGNDSMFAKGFSDGLAHVQTQTGAEATNAAGISGGTAPPPAGPDAANALYALGGYIPATTLNREGAAFGAAADQLPATAAGQGAATIAGIQHQQVLDQKALSDKLGDLAAQVPGLRAQYQAAADTQASRVATQKQAASNAAAHEADIRRQQRISMILATGVGPDGKLTSKAQAELARATGYDPVTGKPTAATVNAQGRLTVARVNARTAIDRLTLAQQKAYSDMYGTDANGTVTLAGRKAALAEWKAEHPAAKGGFTKNQLATLSTKAAKLADLYFYGTPDKTNSSGVVTKGIPAIADYQQALKLALSNGVPMKIAQRALNALYPIGEENRPWIPIQQRMALEQAGLSMTDPVGKPTRAQADWLNAHGYSYHGPLADILAGKTG